MPPYYFLNIDSIARNIHKTSQPNTITLLLDTKHDDAIQYVYAILKMPKLEESNEI